LFKAFVEWSSYALSRRRSLSVIRFQVCFFDVAFVLQRAAVQNEGAMGMHSPDALSSCLRVKGGTHNSVSACPGFRFWIREIRVVHVRSYKRRVAYGKLFSAAIQAKLANLSSPALSHAPSPDRMRGRILQRARQLFLTSPPSRPSTTKSDLPS
jgi:hypothetical protein